MDIGMIVRERDCIAEIVMYSTGTRQWLRMMTTTSTIEDNNMKGEQWTRDRVSIAEDAADHSATREWTRVVHGPSISSMQHGLHDHDRQWRGAREWASPRTRWLYGATEWIDMRQSSTARASTTCSMATLKTGSRIPETETEPASLWRLSGHKTSVSPRPEHPTHAAWPDIQHDWRWHQTTTAKRWPRGSMDRERRLRKRRRTSSQWTSDQVTTSTTSRTTAWKTTTSTRAMTELEFDYGPSAKNDLELWRKKM